MPGLVTKNYGSGDFSWLLNTDGLDESVTGVIDVSTFTAGTHYPNGFIPSGLPVAKVGGVLVPYDATEGTVTGAGVLAGFVLTDQAVVGTADFGVPLYDQGRVIAANLPIAFTAPTAAAKRAAVAIVFV